MTKEIGPQRVVEKDSAIGQAIPRGLLRAAESALMARAQFASIAGMSFYDATTGGYKRNLNAVLGYDDTLTVEHYRSRYERGGIAERIIEAFPRGTWGGKFDIQEDPDPEVSTPFEADVKSVFDRLNVWSRLMRADILAGLGRYAVLVIGAPGRLDQELEVMGERPEQVMYLTPVPEDRAEITEWDTDETSDRFGLPVQYSIKFGSRSDAVAGGGIGSSKKVHWSRVIHIAERVLEDDVFGIPRLRAVWNYLDDLAKVTGGGAEATWQRIQPGMHIDFDPDVERDEAEEAALAEHLDEYQHGMRRRIQTFGARVSLLSNAVSTYGANAMTTIDLIAGTVGIPKRILVGSERGELASGQDQDNWSDRVAERRLEFAEPVIRALIDRLVEYRAIAKPTEYAVVWPTIEEVSEGDKADIISKIASANAAQKNAEGGVIVTADEIRDRFLDLEPLALVTDDGDGATDDGDGGDDGDEPPLPPGRDQRSARRKAAIRAAAARPPIVRIADKNRARFAGTILAMWMAAASKIDARELAHALETRNPDAAARTVVTAIERVEDVHRKKIEKEYRRSFVEAAEYGVAEAKRRGSLARPSQRQRGAAGKDDPLVAIFDSMSESVLAWAEGQSALLIKEISKETRWAVQEAIRDALAEGQSIRELRDKISMIVGLRSDQVRQLNAYADRTGATQKQIDRYAKKLRLQRAQLIARTETMRSVNAGQLEMWQQNVAKGLLPVDVKRVWIDSEDGDVRPSHRIGGQVRGLEEPFELADGTPMEPGADFNCRCTHAIANEEDLKNAHVEATKTEVEDTTPFFRDVGSGEGKWSESEDIKEALTGQANFSKHSRDLYDIFSDEVRGEIKADLVEDLVNVMERRNAGLFGTLSAEDRRELISGLIEEWAGTSGNGSGMSVAAQLAAEKEFGLKTSASAWTHMKGTIRNAKEILAEGLDGLNVAWQGKTTATIGDVMQSMLRAQYDLTQDFFRQQGITEVTMYRGSRYGSVVTNGYGSVALQPMSSFSLDIFTSIDFGLTYLPTEGGALHVVRVPVEQILSTFRTGYGCANEFELVVLGTSGQSAYTVAINAEATEEWVEALMRFLGAKDAYARQLFESYIDNV